MRAIDADILKLAIVRNLYGCNQYELVQQLIDAQPTIGPVKHGHWIDTGRADYYLNKEYRCSCCNSVDYMLSPYCYNCGAKMDGDKNAGA